MNKRSATKKAALIRQEQRRKTMRKWFVAAVSVVITSGILAAAFFFGNQHEEIVKQSTLKTVSKAPKSKVGDQKPVQHTPLPVMEEYPEEKKVGFGLEDLIEKTKKEKIPPVGKPHDRKPVLVLIIDDVSQKSQLAAIRKLPYHITPSIFPPSEMNRHSYRLASGLKHYMIHLPMQSASPKMNSFTKTMKISQSQEQIAGRIREIRKYFPTARYVNNHTGSVFTSNYKAMRKAYIELKRNRFIFIDSRTTGKSVVRKITKLYKDPYIARDVFLDNVQKRSAILNQLKKAVAIAKKRGYAIVIGHPHKATMDALRHAGAILSQVDTLYIDEFYHRYYGKH